MKLSIIFGFRDRETTRVKRCLDSLEQQTFKDFEVLFVDYGSQPHFVKNTKTLVEQYDFCKYIYTDSRGMPWNRSRALNTGAQQSSAEYLMTTDVDMMYPKDFVATFIKEADENKVFHVLHYHLPKGFKNWNNLHKYQNLPIANHALGACHFISRKKYFELQGFDEYFCYWGIEDRDLNEREKAMGLEVSFLNDKTYMHHQWHPTANLSTIGFMPQGLWQRMETHFHKNKGVIQRNDNNWGKVINDRPVFEFLDLENNKVKSSDKLHWYKETQVTKNYALSKMIETFFDLPSGHALAMDYARYPKKNYLFYQLITWWNKAMRATKIGMEFTFNINELHSNVYPFVLDSDAVADYYMNFEDRNGVAILVRK